MGLKMKIMINVNHEINNIISGIAFRICSNYNY